MSKKKYIQKAHFYKSFKNRNAIFYYLLTQEKQSFNTFSTNAVWTFIIFLVLKDLLLSTFKTFCYLICIAYILPICLVIYYKISPLTIFNSSFIPFMSIDYLSIKKKVVFCYLFFILSFIFLYNLMFDSSLSSWILYLEYFLPFSAFWPVKILPSVSFGSQFTLSFKFLSHNDKLY